MRETIQLELTQRQINTLTTLVNNHITLWKNNISQERKVELIGIKNELNQYKNTADDI
tara:strand:- start:19 stop:192 length:174 start_codon:yes stop_codon:yes gene_type:complete